MDQKLAEAAAYAPGRRFVFIHQVAALFCVKRGHDRHIERHIKRSDSVNRHSCRCRISSRADL